MRRSFRPRPSAAHAEHADTKLTSFGVIIENEAMNPRRVHELMREHFPERPKSACDWVVAIDEQGLRVSVFEDIVRRYIDADLVLIEANRKVGGMLDIAAAIDFVAAHANKGLILLANREFSGFVVVESNGVVSGWSN
jgi:hypothetical protein